MNFAEQVIQMFSEQFAEGTKLKKTVADKIIKIIIKKTENIKNVSIEDFGIILSNLKYRLRAKIDMTGLLNKAKDSDIETIVDELVKDRTRRDQLMKSERPLEYYSEKNQSVWFFESLEFKDKVLKAWDKVKIQIMREWTWNHPVYWEVKVTKKTLTDVIKNFNSRERGIDLAVDENHEPNHKALWWFKELFQEGKKTLFATIELTKKGASLINEGAYKYFSPEIVFRKQDEETWKQINNLLVGWAFTNRPFFKAMKPLLASESGVAPNDNEWEFEENHNAFLIFNNPTMNKFLQLLAKFSQLTEFSADKIEELKTSFSELSEDEKTPELEKTFNDAIEKADEGWEGEGEWDASEDKNKGADEWEGEWAWEGEGSNDEGAGWTETPVVKANEDWTNIIQMSEWAYELLKKNAASAAKLVKEAKFREVTDKVGWLVFSESNKVWIALPKSKNKITAFASLLSDKQMAEFFSIMETLQTVAASEMWTDGWSAKQFNQEEVDFLVKNMWFSEKQAKASLEAK